VRPQIAPLLALLLMVWMVLAPCALGLASATFPRARRTIVAHRRLALTLGIAGFAAVLVGVSFPGDVGGPLAIASGAPLIGLVVALPLTSAGWPARDEAPEASALEPIDWDRFTADLQRWAQSRSHGQPGGGASSTDPLQP
jgi:hypothetical protein